MAEVKHKDRDHAVLSASGASRWLNCTPSARLEDPIEETRSIFADEGTLAHEFAELGLKDTLGLISPADFAARSAELQKNELFSFEILTYVQKHIDYVIERYNAARSINPDAIIIIEEKLDFSHIVADGFGTGDVLIVYDGFIEVIDLKYGKGVRVSADDNPQLKLYGLGALRAYDILFEINIIRLSITQPRLDSITSSELSINDLIVWAETVVKPAAVLADAGTGEQRAGSWCTFCKVKAKCRALAEYNMEAARHEFKEVYLLNDDELIDLYERAPMFSKWIEAVATYVTAEAIKGKKWPGYKLVEGRSNRVWKDEAAVIAKLLPGYDKSRIVNEKIKGLAEIEKLVGKSTFLAELSDYIDKPAGKPTLVASDDKRPEYTGGVEGDFSAALLELEADDIL